MARERQETLEREEAGTVPMVTERGMWTQSILKEEWVDKTCCWTGGGEWERAECHGQFPVFCPGIIYQSEAGCGRNRFGYIKFQMTGFIKKALFRGGSAIWCDKVQCKQEKQFT